MSAAVKIIKGVKGPRPKRSNVSSNSSSVQEDAVFVEARQHYQKAIATQCKIQDLKTFLSFLLQRGAYLENNHKEWLDKIFSEIRDLVRGKDVGPLHLTLLMQVVEMRAKDWKAGGSFEAYYREKIPVATQLQKVYEDKKQSTAATKPAIFATPRKTPSPGLQITRSISLDSPRSSPAKDYSAGVRGVFADAKIRHNRESLNFECDIFLPSTFLVDIDDKTWHKLQRKTDSRIKLNQESSILHHISIQGPLKSNIRHCLEVLEELVVPDSDESEEELIAKPIVKLVQKQKSYPGHLEFENLRRSVRKASLEDEGFGSLSHEPRTSDYIIGSTSAHGDTAEQSLRVEPKTPNQERWTLSQRMVSSAQKATERRNDRSVSSSTTAVRALSTESQTWAERAIAAVPVAPVPKSQEYGLTRLPVTTQQSLDEDDSSVWDEGDEDIFLTELESRMGNLHLTKDDDTTNKEQTSPFGKYGIMATIQKQRSKSESACTRQIGDLEKVARESALKSRRDEVKMASPRLVSAWPATPRKSSLPEKPLDWWRSPVPPSDDESSTTSGSGTIHQVTEYIKVPVLRQPIHWAMSLESIRRAEKMVPCTGALGAKKRRILFRNTATDRLKAHGIYQNKAEAEIKYDIDALLALASEPSSLQSPSSFVESWPTLVKLYPTVCLDEPWGFKPQNHKVPSEHQWPKSNRAIELTRSVSTEY